MPTQHERNMPDDMRDPRFRDFLKQQADAIIKARGHRGGGSSAVQRRKAKARQIVRIAVDHSFLHEQSVYVIGCAGNPIKIGIARNPLKRVKELQTGFPHKLRVYFSVEIPEGKAREVEKACHQRLAEYRTHGEWFDIDPYEAIDIVREVVAKS